MSLPCVTCKGKDPRNCGKTACPILAKLQSQVKTQPHTIKKEYQGPAPSPFVGRFGYPKVNVGILSPAREVKDARRYDDPQRWAQENTSTQEIIDMRTGLINAQSLSSVKNPTKYVHLAQEVALSKKPVDIEAQLRNKPYLANTHDPFTAPQGPKGSVKTLRTTSNASVPTKFQKVTDDTDLKAKDALNYLQKKHTDENEIARILSVGTLGKKLNRKLVPTRWSITATDDMLAQNLLKKVYDYKDVGFKAYTGSHMGNYFIVLTMPGPWSYELMEMYQPFSSWNAFSDKTTYTTDYEGPFGRKEYAHETAGGYYAARLPILEHLNNTKRNGSVIALRVISGDYIVPLGVWVVREAIRKALNSKPIEFDSEELLLQYAKLRLKKFFNIDLTNILKNSLLLQQRKQPTLKNFF